MNNTIVYTKEGELTFNLYRVKIKNIPVLVPECLSIYQKYIILILDKGILAENKQDLVNRLSIILNVKKSFVIEFIDLLWLLNYVNFDPISKIFSLSDNYEIIIDRKDKTVMKGNFGSSLKSTDDIYYFDEINQFVSRDYFEKLKVSLSSLEEKPPFETISNINTIIKYEKHYNDIQGLVLQELKKEGIKPGGNFQYSFEDVVGMYYVKLGCSFVYEYENGESKLREIITNINLPKDAFSNFLEENSYDQEIPKFISLHESHYSKIDSNDQSIMGLLEATKNDKLLEEDILSDIALDKAKLEELELEANQLDDGDDSSIKFKKSIANLTDVIRKSEEKLREIKKANEQTDKTVKRVIAENSKLVGELTKPASIISTTITKYAEKNPNSLLTEKVQYICSSIDQALDASNYNAFSQLENLMQSVKDINKQTLKIIFDVIFDNRSSSLNDYFHISKYEKYERSIKNKNIDSVTLSNLKHFHEISNAYGHIYDDYYRGDLNNSEKVTWFQNIGKEKRQEILIAPIYFLSKVKLSEKEINTIERRIISR